MKIFALLLHLLLASTAQAKVHYASRGVQYHIGDDRYERSEDALFVGTYPVVGQEWIQAFRVSEDDTVMVRIDEVRGVDDCPYCKNLVSISGRDMGRLTQDNNRVPFETLAPLAMRVKKGETYLLTIASHMLGGQADDFVIEGVSVETEKAEVNFLSPGPILKSPEEPLPPFEERAPPKREGPCQDLAAAKRWRLFKGEPLALTATTSDFSSTPSIAEIGPGEELSFRFKLTRPAAPGELVEHELGILIDSGQASGWALSFDPAADRFLHGNLMKQGLYTESGLSADYLPGAWNRARLGWCSDGQLRLEVNGRQAGAGISADGSLYPVRLRSLGLGIVVERE